MSYLTRLHNRTIVPLALAIAFAIGCKGASAAEVTWVNGGTGYQSSGSGDWTTINNDATNPGLFPTLATESPTISNGNIVSLSGIGFNELPGAIVDPAAAPLVSDGAVLTILGTLRASGVFTYSGAAVELGLYQNDVVGAAVTGGGQLSLTGTIDVNGTPPAAGDGVGGIHLWSSTSILKLQNSSKITVANQGLNDTVGIAVKGSAATYAGDLSITTLPTSSAAAVGRQ